MIREYYLPILKSLVSCSKFPANMDLNFLVLLITYLFSINKAKQKKTSYHLFWVGILTYLNYNINNNINLFVTTISYHYIQILLIPLFKHIVCIIN